MDPEFRREFYRVLNGMPLVERPRREGTKDAAIENAGGGMAELEAAAERRVFEPGTLARLNRKFLSS